MTPLICGNGAVRRPEAEDVFVYMKTVQTETIMAPFSLHRDHAAGLKCKEWAPHVCRA